MTASGPRWTGSVRLVEERLTDPLRWKKPRRIFVNSMSDLFHEALADDDILRVFDVIRTSHALALAGGPEHTFQVLTKRAARMMDFCNRLRFDGVGAGRMYLGSPGSRWSWVKCLDRLWLGVSVEDQRAADERIPILLQTPAAVRFLSVEPLLGAIKLCAGGPGCGGCEWGGPAGISWVIVGGESGPGSRPMHADWARSLRDQCAAASVPVFVKQMGLVYSRAHGGDAHGSDVIPADLMLRQFPEVLA